MIIGAVSPLSVVATNGIAGSPRLVNLFLDWQLREEDLAALARYDVVVLDADQQVRYPDRVRRLRALHPEIKILAYLPSEEIAAARFVEPPEYPMAKLAAAIDPAWYLKEANGQVASFWPGSSMLNVTNRAPLGAKNIRWNLFLPQFIHDEILSSGLWDGVFLDNTFDGISYFIKNPVDIDGDGKADDKTVADPAWRDGMTTMLRRIRTLNPTALIMGNGGAVYGADLHGAFFEHFPSWSWGPNWKEFRDTVVKNRKPSYTALNVNTDNADRPRDYRLFRYGLGSALVGGGYYSFDRGSQYHSVLWWYDEYEIPLGDVRGEPRILSKPTGKGVAPALWARDYERGLVLVNSTDASQSTTLSGTFERIRGVQDPTVNDGALVNAVTIPARDGLVLLRRSDATEIRNSAFINGSFLRPYDVNGRQVQAGFFAERKDLPSGVSVVVADLDRDGAEDRVTGDKGRVTVLFGDGTRSTFTPFGSSYKGSLSVAVGNMNRDGAWEIVVSMESSGVPHVRIFTMGGRELVAWSAYNPAFRGGVRVAVGDVNGDGLREVVTGAGPGGGPHIRLWKTDGSVWGGSFFAFDAKETGGVSVALGDVDGDGKDEIIVGSGQGVLPRVRIFDYRGMLKEEVVLGTAPVASGLRVTAADLNGDGTAEILVAGLPLF